MKIVNAETVKTTNGRGKKELNAIESTVLTSTSD